MTDISWVATLSDGTVVEEHTGEYQIVPGERKPWVRLTSFLASNKLHLTALALNFQGRTIRMPQENFGRFSLGDKSLAPLFYSLQYLIEGEMEPGGALSQTTFVDLIAHYEDFEVHSIHDLDSGDSWVIVTRGLIPMAATPRSS